MPAGPLRAMSYVVAGGLAIKLVKDVPFLAIMKFGWRNGNVFDNKVVMVDECHNLLRPGSVHVSNLRQRLVGAQDLCLGGFTATPLLDSEADCSELMGIIQGSLPPALISLPRSNCKGYPETFPRRVGDGSVLAERHSLLKFTMKVPL